MRKRLLLLFAASIVGLTPVGAIAASAPGGGGQGLEISPPIINVTANPGDTVSVKIKVRNITSSALTVRGRTDDFGAKGENGEPQLLLDQTQATRYSLKFWVPTVPTLTLQPQEAKTATVAIRVPANAEPGGHYGVIRFTGSAASLEGSGVALTASIGSLILMRVNGEITEKLSVVDTFASNAKGEKSKLFEKTPITITQRFKNEGSVHVQPAGALDVKNLFGKKIAEIPVNNTEQKRSILPDSIRRFDQTFDKSGLFGFYTVSGTLSYGTDKQIPVKSLSFWVLPWKLLLVALAGVVLLGLFTVIGLRRYKASIIKQTKRKK